MLLSAKVIRQRRTVGVSLGDGGDDNLFRRQRVHANFAEYVPLAIILMALAEIQNAAAVTLHLIGASLLVGRLVHAFGVGQEAENFRLRILGVTLTFVSLITGALANLGIAGLALRFAGWPLLTSKFSADPSLIQNTGAAMSHWELKDGYATAYWSR